MEKWRRITWLQVLRWWLSWERDRDRWQKLGEINLRNWDVTESCVWVNLRTSLQQVRVPIRSVITAIRSLHNPIRQVIPLTSHIHLYPRHHSHLNPPSISFLSPTPPSLQNTKLSHSSLYLHAIIMSWHWVQHIQSTAFAQDCLSSLHSHDYELTPECRFSCGHAFLHDRLPSASSP